MQDRPTRAELALGLRHLLADELAPALAGDPRIAGALAHCEALADGVGGPEDATALEAALLDLGAGLDRGPRFRARVGAGVAATLARELDADEKQLAGEAERLAELLGKAPPSDEAGIRELQRELAGEIREGRLDDRLAAVVADLRRGLAERLAVAHPGWTEVADDGRG